MNKTQIAWAAKTRGITGFASPWVSKVKVTAHAYPVASTFAAAVAGCKGKRKPVMLHMLNTGEAGRRKCVFCDGLLNLPAKAVERKVGNSVTVVSQAGTKVDKHSTWTYFPGKGFSGGMHYACSWSNLLGCIAKIRVAV